MRKDQTLRGIGIGVLIRLLGMVLIGALLLVAHTYLVQAGRIPIELNLNALMHFVTTAVVGVAAVLLSKENSFVAALIAAGVLYVLLLFISIVIYDGVSSVTVHSVLGGAAGVVATFLASISRRKKSARWKVKKYSC